MSFEALSAYLDSLGTVYGLHGTDCQVMVGHEVVYRHQTGCSDYDGRRPVGSDDLYHIYSASKVITMIAVLQLAEQGRLSLDDEVAKYLPEFASMRVFDEFPVDVWPRIWPDAAAPTHAAKNPMLLHDMMSMTAGMSYDTASAAIRAAQARLGENASTRELVRAMAEMPLVCEPSTRWVYSLSHDVLAAVVEVVSGMRFGDYLRANLAEPLGIRDLFLQVPEELTTRLAAQYRLDPTTEQVVPTDLNNAFRLSKRYESGGAGITCTLDAYARVMEALANDGIGHTQKRILTPASIDAMRTNRLHGQELADFQSEWRSEYGYGLGVRTLLKPVTARSPVGEFGWDGAAGSYGLADPLHHVSIVYFQHVLNMRNAYAEIHPRLRNLAYEALGM